MMHRRHAAGHQRLVRLVSKRHNVLMLVVLPLQESLGYTLDVEHGVIRQEYIFQNSNLEIN